MHSKVLTLIFLCLITVLSATTDAIHRRIDSLKVNIARLEKTAPNDTVLANQYLQLALDYYFADFAKVIECYQKALPLYEKAHDQRRVADIYAKLGQAYTYAQLPDIGVQYLIRAYRLWVSLEGESSVGFLLSDIGNVFFAKSQYDLAQSYYQRCEVIFKQQKDLFGLSVAYNNLGLCESEKGNLPKALSYFNQAVQLRKEGKNSFLIAHSLNFVGTTYAKMNNHTEAIKQFETAIELLKNGTYSGPDVASLRFEAYNNLAFSLNALGKTQEALQFLSEVTATDTGKDYLIEKADAWSNTGQIKYGSGDKSGALAAYLECYKMVKGTQYLSRNLSSIRGIIQVYRETKQPLLAMGYMDELNTICDKMFKLTDRTEATKLYAAIETYNEEIKTEALLSKQKTIYKIGTVAGVLFLCVILLFAWLSRSSKNYNKQLEFMSNTTFDGILFHENGIIGYINKRFTQITGYSKTDIIGKNMLEFMDTESREYFQKNMANLIKSKGFLSNELTMIVKDGSKLDVEVYSQPFVFKGKEVRIVALRDITERKKYISALLESHTQLKDLVATKDRFFSIIAHDLKNPFNAILGFADLLIKSSTTASRDEIREYAKYIYEASQNAHILLDNLLHWSRAQTGKLLYKPDEVNLKLVISKTLNILFSQATAKKIRLTDDTPSKAMVYADVDMLETILRNLISNALKYTPDNGSVSIHCQKTDQGMVINVTDTGLGMEEQQINNLFKVDNIYSSPGTHNESGTGLGLILCEELLKRHNGSFRITSRVGEGTTFSFILPTPET